MKVWISKYALTQGIYEADAKTTAAEGMIAVNNYEYYHGEGREWHLTKEQASKKAEKMRLKKLETLRKQIIKLENMKFD